MATKKKVVKKAALKPAKKIRKPTQAGVERRRHERRAILDTFHVFLCLKERGLGKFYLRDISENGFAIEIDDTNGEFKKNQVRECRFFVNPGLSLPLIFRVAHLQQQSPGVVIIGAEIVNQGSTMHDAFKAFVKLLDQLASATGIYSAEAL